MWKAGSSEEGASAGNSVGEEEAPLRGGETVFYKVRTESAGLLTFSYVAFRQGAFFSGLQTPHTHPGSVRWLFP